MFKFLKKNKKKKEKESMRFHINESVLRTMSDEIVRCEDINVYFEHKEGQEVDKYVSYDMIRDALITIAYIFTYRNIESSKLSFEGAIRLELNKRLTDTGVQCNRVGIQRVLKIE